MIVVTYLREGNVDPVLAFCPTTEGLRVTLDYIEAKPGLTLLNLKEAS